MSDVADARGGFSDPVVCALTGDSDWLDVVCGVSLHSGTAADGIELSDDELRALDETWQIGYTSRPSNRFSDDIAEVLAVSGSEFTVRLKSGETVRGNFYARDNNGGWFF